MREHCPLMLPESSEIVGPANTRPSEELIFIDVGDGALPAKDQILEGRVRVRVRWARIGVGVNGVRAVVVKRDLFARKEIVEVCCL